MELYEYQCSLSIVCPLLSSHDFLSISPSITRITASKTRTASLLSTQLRCPHNSLLTKQGQTRAHGICLSRCVAGSTGIRKYYSIVLQLESISTHPRLTYFARIQQLGPRHRSGPTCTVFSHAAAAVTLACPAGLPTHTHRWIGRMNDSR